VRLLALLILLLPAAAADSRAQEALDGAAAILRELGPSVPSASKAHADCVSVLKMGKGGFIVGGTGGRGFMSCKTSRGWSAPLVLKVGGTSAGAQIGGAKVELVMVYKNVDDVEAAAEMTPVFAGKAEAAAGDVGSGVSVGGNPDIDGGVVTVSRAKGLYAGAAFEGLAIGPDSDWNERVYGRDRTAKQILTDPKQPIPPEAKAFHAAVIAWAKGT